MNTHTQCDFLYIAEAFILLICKAIHGHAQIIGANVFSNNINYNHNLLNIFW